MAEKTHNLDDEIKKYYNVFGGLLIFTVITVSLSYIHVNAFVSVSLGLIVAITKASLVASIFMHLNHEKKLIYVILSFTAFFFISMMGLIIYGNYSVPEGTQNFNLDAKYKIEKQEHHNDHNVTLKSENKEEANH